MNIIWEFTKLGILNKENLDLQVSIPGRLPNKQAGIVGSTMLFLKDHIITYPEEAFTTSHESLTQRCIMCYDA